MAEQGEANHVCPAAILLLYPYLKLV